MLLFFSCEFKRVLVSDPVLYLEVLLVSHDNKKDMKAKIAGLEFLRKSVFSWYGTMASTSAPQALERKSFHSQEGKDFSYNMYNM